jgi:hypothetical protein
MVVLRESCKPKPVQGYGANAPGEIKLWGSSGEIATDTATHLDALPDRTSEQQKRQNDLQNADPNFH